MAGQLPLVLLLAACGLAEAPAGARLLVLRSLVARKEVHAGADQFTQAT
jgi:hypothetical protein